MAPEPLAYLRAAGTGVVVDCRGDRLPRVLHWGDDLGDLDQQDLQALAQGLVPQVVSNAVDDPVPFSLLPESSAGWMGTPGLLAHREGGDFSTSFIVERLDQTDGSDGVRHRLDVQAVDPDAGVRLAVQLELTVSGLVRQRATVVNRGTRPLTIDRVLLTLPVPSEATELLDLTGRHLRERHPQRHDFTIGTHARENRRGRTGTDATLVVVAGTPGFGFRSGRAWGVHTAWSGNHTTVAEAGPTGVRFLGGGELLLPGEVRLAAEESYTTPWVYGAYGRGLDDMAARFHRFLRGRGGHPTEPRLVTLNTWEAVYFDQSLPRLTALADAAAEVGVERFVLDDGWFRGRRDDRAGLGDWYVDERIWPRGLHPLIDHVTGLGMEFGLWVEPEMTNPDSDLARAHPDWILSSGHRAPALSRFQQVLDLSNPEVFDYLLARLDALLREYPVGYLKWDHNRDLVDAGRSDSHRAGVRAQTLAVYDLMDRLRRAHPHLEIESCSSGGGRVDLAILERAGRVWASDCIDPLERQTIQRWTQQLVPPEMVGAHIGAPESHTTGRAHTLDFRAGTAFFGHLGIEWDLTTASADELARLRQWVAEHKRIRELLHTGVVVRGDHPDPSLLVHGVVSADKSRAVYALVQLTTSPQAPTGRVRLPGLDPDERYRLVPLPPGDRIDGPGVTALPWWGTGTVLPGRLAADVGIEAPMLHPQRLVLVQAERL